MSAPLTREQADSMLRRNPGMGHPDSHFMEAECRALRAIASGAHVVLPAASAEQERERFEAWFIKKVRPDIKTLDRFGGGYSSDDAHCSWLGWQAALRDATAEETASAATARPEARMTKACDSAVRAGGDKT